MATNPAAKAVAAANKLIGALEQPDELERITAGALLDAAQSAARRRPTPQAPMVAAGFHVDGDVIAGPDSGELAAITMGAEFGSTIFGQFGSRHGGGSWLFPTIADPPPAVEIAQTEWLEGLTD